MGIQGLLRNLHTLLVPPSTHQSCQENNGNGNSRGNGNINIQRTNKNSPRHNIRQFANKSIAVDASSWLHKAGYTCADRLVEATENKIRDAVAEKRYTEYMLKRCDELLNVAKISTIYLVFDGVRVPLKSGTNTEREARRKANLAEARRLMAEGRTEAAKDKYRACVKATAEMAQVVAGAVMERWGKYGDNAKVKCVFSPYEADAQLAKLCADGITHAVVTEDSDVLVYSAVCRKPFPIIYKLDKTDGSCDVVTMDWLLNPEYLPPSAKSRLRKNRRDWEDSPTKKSNPTKDTKNSSEIDYYDLGLAPVRRQLPPTTNGKSSNSGNGRSKSPKADNGGPGAALLSSLRSFVSKEACNPGAGVRLFVQACVLSGCDYVSNRLTKVGPVKSFQLVKEVSHRQPHVRFDRLLKSLPKGCRLLPEGGDKINSENGRDGDDSDEFDDEFPLSGLNVEDEKMKYEELLSKSEAVFYYHLVKSISNGKIIPLTPHKPTDSHKGEHGSPSEYSPDIKLFDPKLVFIGSAEEAIANELHFLPSLAKKSSPKQPRIQKAQQNNEWIDTSKRTFPLTKSVQKTISIHRKSNPAQITTLLNSFSKTPSRICNAGNVKSSTSTVTSRSVSSTVENNTNSSAHHPQPNKFDSLARESPPQKNQVNKTSIKQNKPKNPLSSYAHGAQTLNHQHESSASPFPVATNSSSHLNKEMSPLFFPDRMMDNFDYGESPSRSEIVPSTKSRHFCNTGKESRVDLMETFDVPNDSALESSCETGDHFQHELRQDDRTKQKHHVFNETDLQSEESKFDYNQIIPESPPTLSRASKKTSGSKYFQQRGQDDDLIRRVSSSPPEHFKLSCKYESAKGSSPDDAIELSDADGSEDDLTIAENDENNPNNNRTRPLMNDVNKRPFRSPYVKSEPYTATSKKRIRTTSSGPIYAGFQKQNEAPRLNRIGTAPSQKFNSTRTLKNNLHRNKKNMPLPGKRPKGTPSLLDFMSSKRKKL
mmetsp:Transcript_3769/g.7997  ORF Transcript_3769/g.7997 Transcript_3769/m.7997 type:complete len:989 (-) Transcript_3769:220-3186(-)